jgi:hypothetical protein
MLEQCISLIIFFSALAELLVTLLVYMLARAFDFAAMTVCHRIFIFVHMLLCGVT